MRLKSYFKRSILIIDTFYYAIVDVRLTRTLKTGNTIRINKFEFDHKATSTQRGKKT